MKKNYTHIVALLDRSASMQMIIAEMRAGFNNFINEQKKLESECTLTVVQFDNYYDKIFDFVPINEFTELNEKNYTPRGSTALIDSMYSLIEDTGIKLASMGEASRPENVLFIVITDGQENASTKHTNKELKEKIKHQEDRYNWQFTYLGANQDSFSEGFSLGFSNDTIMNYNTTTAGTSAMFSSLTSATSLYRTANISSTANGSAKFKYSEKEQKETENIK